MIQKLVEKSNVNARITPHAFRRSFATFHKRLKTPIEDISVLMGHENINTTKGYIGLDEHDLRKNETPMFYLTGKSK